jgi:MATE family multidrug resistance protein
MEAGAMLAIGLPIIIHNLALVGMGLTDAIMAGLLGAQTLAGVAVGSSAWAPVFLFSLGLIMAQSPTAAHLFGAKRYPEIGRYARQMLWISQLMGWGGLLLLRNATPFMQAIHIQPEIVPVADGYLKAISWGLPGLCLYQVLRFTSEGVGRTRVLLFVACTGLVVNGVLDYIFMYGKLGLPAMGATGTGYATAITQWLMFFGMLIYMWRSRHYKPLELFQHGLDAPDFQKLKELLFLGVPIAVGIFMESSLFSGVGLMMGTLGTDIVAAHQIALNYASFVFMVPMSISLAISVRVGHALGRGDREEARLAAFTGLALCLCFEVLSAASMGLLPHQIVGLYTRDAQVAGIAVSLLYMGAIMQISDGIQVSAMGGLRGYKDTAIPTLITVLAYWGVGFPLAWVFGIPLHLGPQMIWAGFIGGLTVAAVLLTARLVKFSRV